MRKCRVTLGPRCILSNHDLDTVTPITILPIYVFERKFGPNMTFRALHVVLFSVSPDFRLLQQFPLMTNMLPCASRHREGPARCTEQMCLLAC
jgi:hypothetical protein